MALTLFSNLRDPYKIESLELGSFEIDVVLTEKHDYANDIPEYEVEDGFNVSDCIKHQSPRLSLTGITTNTPINYFFSEQNKIIREDLTNRCQQAFNILLKMAGYTPAKQKSGEPIKTEDAKELVIITGLTIYRNMYITSLSFSRDKSTGESLPFAVEFKQVRKVTSLYSGSTVQKTEAPNANQKAKETSKQTAKKTDVGKVETKDISIGARLYNFAKEKITNIANAVLQ